MKVMYVLIPHPSLCLSGVLLCSVSFFKIYLAYWDMPMGSKFPSPPPRYFCGFPHFFQLKGIEIFLASNRRVLEAVIPFFRPYVHDETDGEQVEIGNGDPHLHAPQKEQRRGQLALGPSGFFLALTSVNRLLPHSSMISGSTS